MSEILDQPLQPMPSATAEAVDAVLRRIEEALDELEEMAPAGLRAAETLEALRGVERVERRLAAGRLRLVREADLQGAATSAGATGTAAWLRWALGMHPAAAAGQVRLARVLASGLDGAGTPAGEPVWAVPGVAPEPDALVATGAALGEARVSAAHAQVIAVVMAGLDATVPRAVRDEAEQFLLERAVQHDPRELRLLGMRLEHTLDPERGDRLSEREEEQVERRSLSLRERGDGTGEIRGVLDGLAFAALRTALDPLAAPTPGTDGARDPRQPGRRRADALVELVTRALDGGQLPVQGGERPHISVVMTLATLQKRLGAPSARLTWGGEISAETARKIACDARVVPVLLGSRGELLDVGRATRTVPTALRRALDARDGGCTFPGCGRPPGWCEAHHVWHWADGGPTSIDNTCLLCDHHHRLVHSQGWDIRLLEGRTEFIPPRWIDAARTPRSRPWRHDLDDLAAALASPGAAPDP